MICDLEGENRKKIRTEKTVKFLHYCILEYSKVIFAEKNETYNANFTCTCLYDNPRTCIDALMVYNLSRNLIPAFILSFRQKSVKRKGRDDVMFRHHDVMFYNSPEHMVNHFISTLNGSKMPLNLKI